MIKNAFISGASAFYAIANEILPNTSDLIFRFVRTNEGNDYNATSGVFSCRIPGLYWFSACIHISNADQPVSTFCKIRVNRNDEISLFVSYIHFLYHTCQILELAQV